MSAEENSISIPYHQPRDLLQRFLELTTGLLPFIFLGILVVLSRFYIRAAAVVLLVYTLAWLIRLLGYSYRLLACNYYLTLSERLDWQSKLDDVLKNDVPVVDSEGFWGERSARWYNRMLRSSRTPVADRLNPYDVYNAVIIAFYNEPIEILESTIEAVKNNKFDHDKIILIVACEERAGKKTVNAVKALVKQYDKDFHLAAAIEHPADMPGEAKAKAGNITFSAKYLSSYCLSNGIDVKKVMVTTLDADTRPHSQYFSALTWVYAMTANRIKRSFQPLPLFTNNIWDAPAIVRVVATDSSFWFMIGAMTPQRLRLFSAYAQSLKTLQDVDYWNVETVVEDGHQYWRSYFTFHGDHKALPVWLPIYQDAVLSDGYWKTVSAQFRQLRRWAWGTADTPWLIRQALKDDSISWRNKLIHIYRQLDDYVAWSTAPLILTIGGWLPLLLLPGASSSIVALKLPIILSALQAIALIGLIAPIVATLKHLPPRPKRYTRFRSLMMVVQWALEPIALIAFIALASLNAHLRLIMNRPLETFDTTEKTRRE